MKYFRNYKGYIVRKPEEDIYLEYTFEGAKEWLRTESGSSFERECWLGEGNTCLFEISEEEVLATVSSWNIGLSVRQILNSKECYLFGNDLIYIVIDDDMYVVSYHIANHKWGTRKIDDFWDSWDFDCYCFELIDKKKVVELIFSENVKKDE